MPKTSMGDQFPEFSTVSKCKFIKAKEAKGNYIIVRLYVVSGKVQSEDMVKLTLPDNRVVLFKALNVFVNSQKTGLAVAGEECDVVTYKTPKTKILLNLKEPKNALVLESSDVEFISIGIAKVLYENGKISKSKYEFLYECPVLREKVLKLPLPLSEKDDLVDKVKKKGIEVLKGSAKKLAIATAISLFLYSQWENLNKNCLTKFGKDRLLCKRQVIQRMLDLLRQQAAQCNELQIPSRKLKCLKYIDKKRQTLIKQLADINEKIAKFKPEENTTE